MLIFRLQGQGLSLQVAYLAHLLLLQQQAHLAHLLQLQLGAASHCRISVGVTMVNRHTGEKYQQVCHNGENSTRHNGGGGFGANVYGGVGGSGMSATKVCARKTVE